MMEELQEVMEEIQEVMEEIQEVMEEIQEMMEMQCGDLTDTNTYKQDQQLAREVMSQRRPDEHNHIIELHIMSIQPANKAAEHLISS